MEAALAFSVSSRRPGAHYSPEVAASGTHHAFTDEDSGSDVIMKKTRIALGSRQSSTPGTSSVPSRRQEYPTSPGLPKGVGSPSQPPRNQVPLRSQVLPTMSQRIANLGLSKHQSSQESRPLTMSRQIANLGFRHADHPKTLDHCRCRSASPISAFWQNPLANPQKMTMAAGSWNLVGLIAKTKQYKRS
jgi:hypothetical protein